MDVGLKIPTTTEDEPAVAPETLDLVTLGDGADDDDEGEAVEEVKLPFKSV